MREVSYVKNLRFNFEGSVTKNALVIGDADNDNRNELVCANLQGNLAIFKDSNTSSYANATNLGMVTACCIGNFTNQKKNLVAGINMEGWLYLFDVAADFNQLSDKTIDQKESQPTTSNQNSNDSKEIFPFYQQRMPANCKVLTVADLDGDGQKELIIGLTDRVLRTYRWINVSNDHGKFIGIYKWEFADQIGAISLNPSQHENCLDIIVAQPGGTFAKLECIDKKTSSGTLNAPRDSQSAESSIFNYDNVRTEKISRLTPEYHQLAQNQMRNHHISTEVLGGIRKNRNSNNYSLIVVATLDGTLMLVDKDSILWSLQLDHQVFALSTLTSKSNESSGEHQYFVACAWNGKTYIIDEDRNHLGFMFSEAVSAFTAGEYYFDGASHPSLVYATFNNQIFLYYDVTSDDIKPIYLMEEIISNEKNSELALKLFQVARKLDLIDENELDLEKESQFVIIKKLLSDLLQNVKFESIKI